MSVEAGQLFERRSNGAILRVEGFHENRSRARLENVETGRLSRVRVDRLEGPDYRPREDLRDGEGEPNYLTAKTGAGDVTAHFPVPTPPWSWSSSSTAAPTATVHLFEPQIVVTPEPVRSLIDDPPSAERNWLPIIIALVVLMLPVSLALSALLS